MDGQRGLVGAFVPASRAGLFALKVTEPVVRNDRRSGKLPQGQDRDRRVVHGAGAVSEAAVRILFLRKPGYAGIYRAFKRISAPVYIESGKHGRRGLDGAALIQRGAPSAVRILSCFQIIDGLRDHGWIIVPSRGQGQERQGSIRWVAPIICPAAPSRLRGR